MRLPPRRLLPLALTLGLVATLTILTLVEWRVARQRMAAEWEAAAAEQAQVMAAAIQPLLLNADRSTLSRVVTRLGSTAGVRSVAVVDPQGIIVAGSNGQGVGARLGLQLDGLRQAVEKDRPEITWVEAQDGGRIRFLLTPILTTAAEPTARPSTRGALLIGLDAEKLDDQVRRAVRSLALANALAGLTLILLGWAAVRSGLVPVCDHTSHMADPLPETGGAVVCHTDRSQDSQPDDGARQRETEAERVRHRLEQIYASLPIGLMYVAADLIVEHVSQSLAFLHGRPVEDHLGKPLPSLLPTDRWSRIKPIIEDVLKTGAPYHGYEEVISDPRTPERVRTVLCDYYPDVTDDGIVQGVHLAVLDITAEKEAQQERERDLNELMAKNRELDQMAIRDPLTGLYNRRFFDEALTREWQQFQRSGEAFTVIIMDVDAFKAINDDFGHEAGDRGLQQVGATLKANLRESDLIARVGGDEFAALLPRTDAEQSQQVAEKLSDVLRALRLTTATGDIPMSLSLGAATVPGFPPVSSAAELLRVADKRMYEAKRLASTRRSDAG